MWLFQFNGTITRIYASFYLLLLNKIPNWVLRIYYSSSSASIFVSLQKKDWNEKNIFFCFQFHLWRSIHCDSADTLLKNRKVHKIINLQKLHKQEYIFYSSLARPDQKIISSVKVIIRIRHDDSSQDLMKWVINLITLDVKMSWYFLFLLFIVSESVYLK